jgi:hypothetical protein
MNRRRATDGGVRGRGRSRAEHVASRRCSTTTWPRTTPFARSTCCIDCLELRSVDGDTRCTEQIKLAAQRDELATDPTNGLAIVLAEIRDARDKNFTEAKMKRRLERVDESIARYLSQLETADRHGDAVPEAKVARLKSKIEKLKEEIVRLNAINAEMMKSKDKQISLTDPDARSMATSGKDTGIVGYNVQIAVDTQHHLIVAHEVTNVGTDRHQLANMDCLRRKAPNSAPHIPTG